MLTAIKATRKTGPVAAYAEQGYCPTCDQEGQAYGGRFFAPVASTRRFDAAAAEWEQRPQEDLARTGAHSSALPFGFMTHKLNGGIPNHGFTHWWTMFNARASCWSTHTYCSAPSPRAAAAPTDRKHAGVRRWGRFQQYLRNQNMFTFLGRADYDKSGVPHMFANANYHPKSNRSSRIRCLQRAWGAGNWAIVYLSRSMEGLATWAVAPWEAVANDRTAITSTAAKLD